MLAAIVLLATLVIAPRSASADIKIRQVHPDNQGMFSTGDWVELQLTAAGQSFVGRHIRTFDPGGTLMTDYMIPPPNGQVPPSQSTILIGNGSTVGGTTPDFNAGLTSDLDMTGADGAACFTETGPAYTPIDCVSYGAFTGTIPTAGTPATATAFGATLERSITPNCPTLLEDADDTDNSATDFAPSTRAPRNSTVTPTETPCPPPPPPPIAAPAALQGVCKGQAATLTGTAANDVLVGTPRRDVIAGLEGNDTLRGLSGKDLLCGGLGDDKLIGGNAKDRLFGEGGDDTCKGGKAKDIAKTCEVKRAI